MIEPRVYCGTYGKYNSGSLKGEWIDLLDFGCKEDFYEYCEDLHSDERDPELMFQDWECEVRHLISESWVIPKIWEIGELDEYKQKQLYIYMEATGADLEEALDRYEDMFYFHRDNTRETMEQLHPQIQEIMDMNLDFVTISPQRFQDMHTRVEIDNEVYFCDTNF